MQIIIGVRFEKTGRIYYFDPLDIEIQKGDKVIVETVRGVECGHVVLSPREISDDAILKPLKPIIRKATEEDIEEHENLQDISQEAFRKCKQIVAEQNLDMKMVHAEYTFDRKKLIFYFVAEGRVDFRDLVKILAAEFKTRIELRQIGSRDATKKIGGLGSCGRPLCCSTFLTEFAPVGIKMLKEQNVSLNPSQISGHCGRLMCCLAYDQHTYEELGKGMPKIGQRAVQKDTGEEGIVENIYILKQEVKVLIDNNEGEKEIRTMKYDCFEYYD